MKLLSIINKLDAAFPIVDAANWDFVGWQVKSKIKNVNISDILIAIDVTESVINEAIRSNIKLIIVHHPFIFAESISSLSNSKWKKVLYNKLIKNNINVYVLHTNFDKSFKGMAFLIARDLKLKNFKHFDSEKFSVLGYYHDLSLIKIIKSVKKYFGFKKIKVITNNLKVKINKVVIAPGSGGIVVESLNKVREAKNDVSLVITGEIKWHQELEARDKNINVLVLGHSMEEKFVIFMNQFLFKEIFLEENVRIKNYFLEQSIFI